MSDNPKLFEWKMGTFYQSEITLRDLFALAVIAGNDHSGPVSEYEDEAAGAYALADALLAERAKRQG